MVGFSDLSDTDDSAVEEIISQAQDAIVLEQVSAINCSGFTDSVLPNELESRFRKLKSFPLTKTKPTASKPSSLTFSGRVEDVSTERNPDLSPPDMGSDPKSLSNYVSPPLGSKEKKEVSQEKEKSRHGFVTSPSYSSHSSEGSSISSALKQNPGKKSHSKSKSKSGSLSPPLSSANSLADSPSPPRKAGCFWCSPKKAPKKKSKEDWVAGMGFEWEKDDHLVSDLGSISKKEQEKILKKAMKEEQRIHREAQKIVKWAKAASARMDASVTEDEDLSDK